MKPYRSWGAGRFRSGRDVQYAFAYFHYIIGQATQEEIDFGAYWRTELDADGDGELSANEVLTLAAVALGKEPEDAYVDRVYACARAKRTFPTWAQLKRWVSSHAQVEDERWAKRGFAVTLASTTRCEDVVEGVRRHAKQRRDRESRGRYVVEPTLDEVAFEMLSDDYNTTKSQLDSIRARRTKFVCVNDNVDQMTPQLAALFRDFFESFYPKRSQFELPHKEANAFLRLEDFRAEKRRARLEAALAAAALLLLLFGVLAKERGTRERDAHDGETDDDANDRPKAE